MFSFLCLEEAKTEKERQQAHMRNFYNQNQFYND
jgi:hypothetical protein